MKLQKELFHGINAQDIQDVKSPPRVSMIKRKSGMKYSSFSPEMKLENTLKPANLLSSSNNNKIDFSSTKQVAKLIETGHYTDENWENTKKNMSKTIRIVPSASIGGSNVFKPKSISENLEKTVEVATSKTKAMKLRSEVSLLNVLPSIQVHRKLEYKPSAIEMRKLVLHMLKYNDSICW